MSFEVSRAYSAILRNDADELRSALDAAAVADVRGAVLVLVDDSIYPKSPNS